MQDKFLSAIGLARRAGAIALGTAEVRDSMKNGKAKLVIVASDVSENTKKEITDTAAFYYFFRSDYGKKKSRVENDRAGLIAVFRKSADFKSIFSIYRQWLFAVNMLIILQSEFQLFKVEYIGSTDIN